MFFKITNNKLKNKPKNADTKKIKTLLGFDFSIGTDTGSIIANTGVSSFTFKFCLSNCFANSEKTLRAKSYSA